MKRHSIILILTTLLLLGCAGSNYTTVRHVTPVNRNRYYHAKQDRYKKRVKLTKKKILKRSPPIHAQKSKPKKSKTDPARLKEKDTVRHEADTTGF